MNFGTFCSGIGAPEVAWSRLGWKPRFFSEISPFASAVLKAHWPDVPNLGDMNFCHEKDDFKSASVDVICAGTPCQSFSLAGLRAGLNSPNGNLALQFLRLLDQKRPRWMVWENVPGVLSSWSDSPDCPEVEGIGPEHGRDIDQTNDFDTFLAGLVEIGYGVAWRVLDAQGFGVPQRRQRVFVVGYYGGDWRRAAAVLFDPGSLSRHPSKGSKTGTGITAGALCGSDGGSDDNDVRANHIVAGTVSAKWRKGTGGPSGDECQNLVVGAVTTRSQIVGDDKSLVVDLVQITSKTNRSQAGETSPTMATSSNLVVFNGKASSSQSMNPGKVSPTLDVGKRDGLMVFDMRNGKTSEEVTMTLQSGQPGHGWSANTVPHTTGKEGVRRLMPLECERLQGFPDGHTDIIYRGKPAKDGPRYEVLGNSMAVPVLEWLGARIDLVDKISANE